METYPSAAVERAMKIQEVILRAGSAFRLWRRCQQRQFASAPRQIGRKSEGKPPLCHNATMCKAL
jgi:hypothetical protein